MPKRTEKDIKKQSYVNDQDEKDPDMEVYKVLCEGKDEDEEEDKNKTEKEREHKRDAMTPFFETIRNRDVAAPPNEG
ncbi:hypothetical protein N0V85_004381 [Neurospora sp. IMI 360204]|nr:hypothetical protein N0V85_004381 [Neurospora sp. IMI 360204]